MNIAGFHSRITTLQRRLETLPDALAASLNYNKEQFLELKKEEILSGRNSDGEPFTPGYPNDPYFKSREAALEYADYKYSIESIHNSRIKHLNYPAKDPDTPNLRLTKDRYNSLSFQDRMYIYVGRESYLIGSTFEDSYLISAKYNNKVFPPGPLVKQWFWNNILVFDLRRHLRGQ